MLRIINIIIKKSMVHLLINETVIKPRDFVLKSGKTSKYYLDFRSLISKPKLFHNFILC